MSLSYDNTPEGSEVDELEFANALADQLYLLACTDQIADKPYIRCANYLDTVPLVGDYFRYWCAYG